MIAVPIDFDGNDSGAFLLTDCHSVEPLSSQCKEMFIYFGIGAGAKMKISIHLVIKRHVSDFFLKQELS